MIFFNNNEQILFAIPVIPQEVKSYGTNFIINLQVSRKSYVFVIEVLSYVIKKYNLRHYVCYQTLGLGGGTAVTLPWRRR